MANDLTGYDLSRKFFDYSFANPEKIKPIHVSIFFFAIEHCNRLGWKGKFGFPTSMVLDAIGVKSYAAYKRAFDELVGYGFINVIEYSKNQYSSNIIALSFGEKAIEKALDNALIKHNTKHYESTIESTIESNGSIDKQVTINKEQERVETPPADLSNSNLYRQPTIPTKAKVYEVFKSNGGTKEMADKFWDNNEAAGWFFKSSPIVNFASLVPGFIAAWKNFDKGKVIGIATDLPQNKQLTAEYIKNKYGT